MEIGRWLHADAVVYGEVVDYEAYYGFLVAAWRVTARIRIVSTRDGHELFSCTDTRYSTNVTPAIDPIDIVLNSALNLLELRDITLARAEAKSVGKSSCGFLSRGAMCLISKRKRSNKRDPFEFAKQPPSGEVAESLG